MSQVPVFLWRINKQRKLWIKIGFIGLILFISAFIVWEYIFPNITFLTCIVCCGLLLIVTWWCWTMKVIKQLITFKVTETAIITEIIDELQQVNEEVSKLTQSSKHDEN